jgi:hypothetical protein
MHTSDSIDPASQVVEIPNCFYPQKIKIESNHQNSRSTNNSNLMNIESNNPMIINHRVLLNSHPGSHRQVRASHVAPQQWCRTGAGGEGSQCRHLQAKGWRWRWHVYLIWTMDEQMITDVFNMWTSLKPGCLVARTQLNMTFWFLNLGTSGTTMIMCFLDTETGVVIVEIMTISWDSRLWNCEIYRQHWRMMCRR